MPTFLPQTLGEWLTVLAIVVGWAVATQRVWRNLVEKVNGVGARVAVLEERKAENSVRLDRVEAGHTMATADRAHIHERMGSLVKENENLAQQITDLKIDVIGHINEVKTMIREDLGAVRERVVRLEVVNEMKQRGEVQ